jgi:hypothetical protein
MEYCMDRKDQINQTRIEELDRTARRQADR